MRTDRPARAAPALALRWLAPGLVLAAAASGCSTLAPLPAMAVDEAKARAAALIETVVPPPPPPAVPWRAGPGQVLLLGEVHDNATQHARRHEALAALLARGERPALVMEQFDRERQGAIDAALAEARAEGPAGLDAQVEAVVQAGGALPGWQWPLYRPYIRLALQHGLPIVAGNVSRAEAREVIQKGLAATGWKAEVPEDILQAQARAIERSHCGQVDLPLARRLALAQVARDQFMAYQVVAHAMRGAVLLAGNGHVRADIGVPRWLPAPLRAITRVVGGLESGDDPPPGAFDEVLTAPAPARPDPCEGLRMPTGAASAPAAARP